MAAEFATTSRNCSADSQTGRLAWNVHICTGRAAVAHRAGGSPQRGAVWVPSQSLRYAIASSTGRLWTSLSPSKKTVPSSASAGPAVAADTASAAIATSTNSNARAAIEASMGGTAGELRTRSPFSPGAADVLGVVAGLAGAGAPALVERVDYVKRSGVTFPYRCMHSERESRL